MYCMKCGTSLPESANFCFNCGESTNLDSKITPTPKEWEFNYFKADYKKGGAYYLTHGRTEESIRTEIWNSEKSSILPQIQEYFDDGWQALSDAGPNSFRFFRRRDKDDVPYLSVSSFFVELQRPAIELTQLEKEIIGIWEQEGKKAREFRSFADLADLAEALAPKVRYEFRKNKTYSWKNTKGEEVNRGVFEDNGNNQIVLIPRLNEELNDECIRFENEKLILTRRYVFDNRIKDFIFIRAAEQNKAG